MKVPVKQIHTEQPVYVCIEGECIHNDTHIELFDNGYYNDFLHDWVDQWESITTCSHCGAWYDEFNTEWVDADVSKAPF